MSKRVPEALPLLLAVILIAGPALFSRRFPSSYAFELSSDEANHWLPTVWLIALWLAIALAIRTDVRNRGNDGHGGYIALQVVMGILFVGMALFNRVLDWSGSHEVQGVDRADYRLVLREEDCGATCSADLSLRQEWTVVPGLLGVRYLGYWSYAGRGAIVLRRSGSRIDSFAVHIEERGARRPVATDTVVVVAHSLWDRTMH